MGPSDVLIISTIGYIIAFAVLGLLALIIRLITTFFPERQGADDAALLAAVTTTYQTIFPGATVTKLEETP